MARRYEGKVGYFGEGGVETGREFFTVTVHPDGTRTLRSLCEMDQVSLTRDVTYTVDKDFRSIDCFVRVINENKFVGSGWFQFNDTHAVGESFTAADGRISQKLPSNGRVRLFGTHPIVIDIWKCAHVKAADPGKLQVLDNCMNCSPVTNGASGPMLYYKQYNMYYQGKQKVTVPAGTFDCEFFHWDTGTGRTLHLYSNPGDWLPVRVVVPEGKRYYELLELREIRS